MAVPSSGELREYADIGVELGVAQSNVSLRGMSAIAGFTEPDAMSEFYGYSGATPSFNTVLYEGDETTNKSITGVGFQPDFVWIKNRDNVRDNALFDSVRGQYKFLSSNSTSSEQTYTNTFVSFDSDGFTVNQSSAVNWTSMVAWCWKAGGAAVTNTDGTITSQVSANPEAGFSIVSYNGNQVNSTVGHGLSSAPRMIITKGRNTVNGWPTLHYDGATVRAGLRLNSTEANNIGNGGVFFQNLAPTSSVFYLGANDENNRSTSTNIAYCFAEVAGYSKIGSYVGTGSAGNFQDCGFEPSFWMAKRADGVGNWFLLDNKRGTNPNGRTLFANTSSSEQNYDVFGVNFVSNGFSFTGPYFNDNNATFIYMAFANQF